MFEKKNSSFQREYLKQAKIPLKPWLWCEKEYLKDTILPLNYTYKWTYTTPMDGLMYG